jgi:hypothetical protein
MGMVTSYVCVRSDAEEIAGRDLASRGRATVCRTYLRWGSEGNAPLPKLREAFEVFEWPATPEMLDVELQTRCATCSGDRR